MNRKRLMSRKRPNFLLSVIKERIRRLFQLASSEIKTNPERAIRYVSLARKLGKRYNVRFPKELKIRFCKRCGIFLQPGYNVKIRIRSREKIIEYICECGFIKRFSFRKEKKGKYDKSI